MRRALLSFVRANTIALLALFVTLGGTTGAAGTTGLQGVQGEQGVPGPSNAYTNYGTLASIAQGTTQTVASVTVPPGVYTLSGQIRFSEGNGDGQQAVVNCNYVSFGTVH